MKKRVFFLLESMGIGGVEKALLGLISIIPLDQYDVHVGLIHKKGELLNLFPKEVTVHEVSCYDNYWRLINDPPVESVKQMLKLGFFLDAFVYSILLFLSKLISNRYWFYRYILRKEPMAIEEYDLAVSFASLSMMIDYYVCEKVKAKKKCGWIHFDVSRFGIDKGMTSQLYKKYDKIFIVSETGKEIFDKMFLQFTHKTEVFYNVVSQEQVIKLADIGPTFADDFGGKRILTVGRISEEKGQRVAIDALHLLLQKKYRVRWYFVGDGKDMAVCKIMANKLNISQEVVFMGAQINPYGFMKDCDIYMQPSRHEGFCITLAEALCFGHPIVATDFTGAKEQLRSRPNGIVTGMSAEDIALGLEKILINGCQECQVQELPTYNTKSFFDLLTD